MIGKKINQLATELAPVSTDLTIIGDPTTGVSKKITLAQLGAIFSGAVSFYTNLAGFPATGDINVIYCAKDTQKLYLWSGSAYVEVFPSQALLDTYQLRSEKGVSNGYASLDSSGKVPISQLPSSIMEYKGTWNASTNTPTLANGTGDTGDVYICNVAGTVNFGAGPITFAVGDYVIYSGTIWQRSSGAVGTVTSVAASITGDAIGITGSPVTTSGTLAFAFAGTGTQYIKGDGTLATFPSTIAQAERLITEVYNSTGATLTKGTIVYINGGQGNLPTVTKALATGDSTSAQTFGVVQADITNNNNGYVVVAGKLSDLDTQAYTPGTPLYLSSTTAGTWTSTKQYAPNHLVYIGVVVRAHPTQGIVEIKIQNGYELDELHNVAAQTPSNNDGLFWESATSLWKNKSISTILGGTPITGSGNVNAIPKFTDNSVLGNSVMEDDGNFVSMRGLKLNASAGVGNTINFQQGTGITAGGLGYSTIGASSTTGFIFYIDQNTTSRNFILDTSTITSDAQRTYSMPATSGTLALVSQLTGGTVTSVGLSSATSGVTIGSSPITTSGTITLAIATASGSQQGLLSSIDWTTFNNKQDALTNPVTGTGTTNYLPKFTGTSTIGNSIVQDDGSTLTIGGALSGRNATFTSSTANIGIIGTGTFSYLQLGHNGGATKYSYLVATNDGMLDIESNIVKFTDYSGASERMRINASGNVSIGNTNDTYKLDVSGTGRYTGIVTFGSTGGSGLRVYGGSGTNQWDVYLNSTNLRFSDNTGTGSVVFDRPISGTSATFSSSVTANRYILNGSNGNSGQIIQQGDLFSTAATNFLIQASSGNGIGFLVNGGSTFNMFINSTGNVGIGTTTPAYTLDVSGTGRFTGTTTALTIQSTGINQNAQINFVSTATTWNVGTNIGTNTNFEIYNGATRFQMTPTGAATFSSSVTQSASDSRLLGGDTAGRYIISNSDTSAYMAIYGSASATANQIGLITNSLITFNTGSGYSERMRITGGSGTDVLIGTTSNPYTASGRACVLLNGSVNSLYGWSVGGSAKGYMYHTGTDVYLENSVSGGFFNIAQVGAGYISLTTNGSERLRITSGGSLLVGASSIAAPYGSPKLFIVGGAVPLTISNGDNTGTYLQFNVGSAGGVVNLQADARSGDYPPLTFTTGASERMRITSGGNVGIGTTSPASYSGYTTLEVAASTGGVFRLKNNAETGVYEMATTSSNTYLKNVTATDMWFGTNNTERMRIGSGGLIYMNNLGGYSGSFSDVRYDTSSKELFYQTSSRRYKDNIVNLENTLSKVNQLRAVRFIDKHTQRENCGFIAEEVIEIIPDVVFKKEIDGKLEVEGINYSDFAPFIIKALQEQQAEIEALKLELKNK